VARKREDERAPQFMQYSLARIAAYSRLLKGTYSCFFLAQWTEWRLSYKSFFHVQDSQLLFLNLIWHTAIIWCYATLWFIASYFLHVTAAVQVCSSAAVQQCSSAAVHQCSSAAVHQCISAALQQCSVAEVQRCSSAVQLCS
jgi:hypothetical protein